MVIWLTSLPAQLSMWFMNDPFLKSTSKVMQALPTVMDEFQKVMGTKWGQMGHVDFSYNYAHYTKFKCILKFLLLWATVVQPNIHKNQWSWQVDRSRILKWFFLNMLRTMEEINELANVFQHRILSLEWFCDWHVPREENLDVNIVSLDTWKKYKYLNNN